MIFIWFQGTFEPLNKKLFCLFSTLLKIMPQHVCSSFPKITYKTIMYLPNFSIRKPVGKCVGGVPRYVCNGVCVWDKIAAENLD